MDKAETLAKKVTSEADAAEEGGGPPRMSLHFQSTGVLETVTQLGKIDSVKTGSWKLLQEDSGDMTTIECSIEGLTSTHEVRWVDDSTIRLAPPNMSGQKMILKFVRKVVWPLVELGFQIRACSHEMQFGFPQHRCIGWWLQFAHWHGRSNPEQSLSAIHEHAGGGDR